MISGKQAVLVYTTLIMGKKSINFRKKGLGVAKGI